MIPTIDRAAVERWIKNPYEDYAWMEAVCRSWLEQDAAIAELRGQNTMLDGLLEAQQRTIAELREALGGVVEHHCQYEYLSRAKAVYERTGP